MKRRLIGLLVGVMCLASLVGCGDKSENSEKDVANAIENAVNDPIVDSNSNSNSGSDSAKENGEETYVASDEIVNAKFEDHIIQIGDEIFQEGGYITFGELVEELGDKYTLTDMTVEGLIAKGKHEIVHITKNDSSISIKAYIENYTDEQISAADAIVVSVLPDGDFAEANTFIAGGRTIGEADMSYADVVDMLKSEGYLSTAHGTMGISDYFAGSLHERENSICVKTVGKDKNLLGCYPTVGYEFIIDTSINKVSEVKFEDGTSNHNCVVADTSDEEFAGMPITAYSEMTDEELNAIFDKAKAFFAENNNNNDAYELENLTVYTSNILYMDSSPSSFTLDGNDVKKTELVIIFAIDGFYDKTKYAAVEYECLARSVIGTVEGKCRVQKGAKDSVDEVLSNFEEERVLDSVQ